MLIFLFVITGIFPVDTSRHLFICVNLNMIIEYNKENGSRVNNRKQIIIERRIKKYFMENISNKNIRFLVIIDTNNSNFIYPPFINARQENRSLDWDILISFRRPFCLGELLFLIKYASDNFDEIRAKQIRQSGDVFGLKPEIVKALKPDDVRSILESYKSSRAFKRYQKQKFCID